MENQNKILSVKLSADEWDKLDYLVKKTGLNTRTAYVKAAIFNKQIKVVKTNLATERVLASLNSARRSMESVCASINELMPKLCAAQNYAYLQKLGGDLRSSLGDFIDLINEYDDLAKQDAKEQKDNEL